ncbi:MAG TPA: TniB family NTP-binding protein [Acidobacteriaceae bacterium]|jgi:hypothetical protein|nr:TniB family NTP-binding protein [Acidobacteriaceae bacterium]
MKIKTNITIVDKVVVPHTAFMEAEQQIEQCLQFAGGKTEAMGLAIVGEAGTGKTSVMSGFRTKYGLTRDKEGLSGQILFATVPPQPTIRSLAGALLAGFSAGDWERGSADEKYKRVRKYMTDIGIRMVMLDEFQHFYNRQENKMMYDVAEWLKVLMDQTRVVLVVAGTPPCTAIIGQNEQLRRRFMAPIWMPRFSWQDMGQRKEFRCILKKFHEKLAAEYETPVLHSEEMAFRFYCASGGLISYLVKLLQKAERNAIGGNKTSITMEDLNVADRQVSYSLDPSQLLHPFDRTFSLSVDMDILERAAKIGSIQYEEEQPASRGHRKAKKQSLDSMLVKR